MATLVLGCGEEGGEVALVLGCGEEGGEVALMLGCGTFRTRHPMHADW